MLDFARYFSSHSIAPMRFLKFLLALFCLCGFFPASAQSPAEAAAKLSPLPAPSASARELFAKHKARMVQVRVLRKSANEQSGLGSGFVVEDRGVEGAYVVTNYHVISALVINPDKFRIELRHTSERAVKATLIAVDVIHDLAVLRTEPDAARPAWPVFSLRDTALVQGERIFALGHPLELGFLISEGIYNGLVEARIYEQILFSGALNSGMSGGAAIDESGRVVGVNVATYENAMLISFLVPARYARALLGQAVKAAPRKEWRSEIGSQLLVHQQFMAGKLLDMSAKGGAPEDPALAARAKAGYGTQMLSGRAVPTLDGSLTKCWAGGRDGERVRFQRDSLYCALKSSVYVQGNRFGPMHTGSLSLTHVLLRNEKLATPQFLKLDRQNRFALSASRSGGADMTPSECRDDYLSGTEHVYRVSVCLRAYRKFEGLYDFTIEAIQVDDARERLESWLHLNGVSFENGERLSRMFLERLQ